MLTFDVKTWLMTLVFVLVLSAWDINGRLYPESDHTTAADQKMFSQTQTEHKVSSAHLAKIISLYDNFDKKVVAPVVKVPSKAPAKKVGLDAQQQSQQAGRLDKFYIGEHRFVLKGIFTDKYRFAVLYRENLSTGKQDEIRVENQQLVGDYRVSKISENQIGFTLNDRVVELSIF